MKKTVLIISLLVNVVLAVMLIISLCGDRSCSPKDDAAVAVSDQQGQLGKPKQQGYDRLVDAYDAFVRSRTNDSLSIGEAYAEFFMREAATVESAGDLSCFQPDSVYYDNILADFVSGEFAIPFVQRAGHSFINPKDYKYEDSYIEGLFHFDFDLPSLEEFINGLATRNPLYMGLAEYVSLAGDMTQMMWRTGHPDFVAKMNFNDKDERFLVALIYANLYLGNNFYYTLSRQ
ncbi:hypothetical protein LJC45_05465 [Alistipes sp. OttesenSCG-928-B03]|nr:hypothetical protein [Alistipes sp. OttesenSCG-928-B03]